MLGIYVLVARLKTERIFNLYNLMITWHSAYIIELFLLLSAFSAVFNIFSLCSKIEKRVSSIDKIQRFSKLKT